MKEQLSRLVWAVALTAVAGVATGCSSGDCPASTYPDQVRVDLTSVQAAAADALAVELCIDGTCTSFSLAKSDSPLHVQSPMPFGFGAKSHEIRVEAKAGDKAVFSGVVEATPSTVDYPAGDDCASTISVISVKADSTSTLEVLTPQ